VHGTIREEELKEYLAETCFEKGWESVDRNFRKLSLAAGFEGSAADAGVGSDTEQATTGEISQALDRLSSQVDLFADLWLHFHMRFEALVHEYGLEIDAAQSSGRDGPGKGPQQG